MSYNASSLSGGDHVQVAYGGGVYADASNESRENNLFQHRQSPSFGIDLVSARLWPSSYVAIYLDKPSLPLVVQFQIPLEKNDQKARQRRYEHLR